MPATGHGGQARNIPGASRVHYLGAKDGPLTDDVLVSLVEGTASTIGSDFFRTLVRHLAAATRVRCALVAECVEPARTHVRTMAFWAGGSRQPDFEYGLSGTPCEEVLAGELRCHPRGVRSLFPADADLARLDAEGYMGVPLVDSRGAVLGHLAVVHDAPLEDLLKKERILRIFAARAAAELERRRMDDVRDALVQRLHNALRVLRRLLPVCAWCRKIRDDRGYWSELEAYLREHADVDFTHGICPDCARRVCRQEFTPAR